MAESDKKPNWHELLQPRPGPKARRLYKAASGLSLRDASIFYGDADVVERFARLWEQGYDVEPEYDPWPDESRDRFAHIRNVQYREEKTRLEFGLLRKLSAGTLFATGFSHAAPLDEPATRIAADRWRILTPDFDSSSAAAPGMIITGILVFEPNQATAGRGENERRRFSSAELKRWYVQHVEECTRSGLVPSREEESQEANRVFGRPIPREAVRSLRRQLAPAEWRRQGRRRQSGTLSD
jgi:hypothetical protein